MAVVPMQKITICALKKNRKAILEYLQLQGCVQIDRSLEETETFTKNDTASAHMRYKSKVANTDRALEILQKYVPEKVGLLASLEGRKEADEDETAKIIAKRHWYNTMVNGIIEDAAKIDACDIEIARCRRNIEGLDPWLDLDIPINTEETGSSKVFIGTLPPNLKEKDIRSAVEKDAPELADRYELRIVSSGKDQTCIAAVCHKNDADLLYGRLRANGYTKISFFSHRTPEGKVKKYTRKIKTTEKEREEIVSKLGRYAAYRDTFRILSDYYRVRSDKYELLGTLLQSKKTFIITGACPKAVTGKLEQKLTSDYKCFFEKEDYAKDEEMPVLLDNPRALASGESILSSYGLPSRADVDPTDIMTICYIVLFGIMLSDAAYGLLMFLVCFVLIKKFPDMGKNLQKSLRLFMYCGLSTVFWGVMFGGYFGDVIDVVSKTFFDKELTIPAVWFVPLNEPMKMLVVALAIGLVHLFLGLGIKGIKLLKQKDILGFLGEVMGWYMFLAGLLLMLAPTPIFASITNINITFGPAVKYVSYALAGVGAVLIVTLSERSNKNPVLNFVMGLYGLYGVTGWLSDLLSYSRLLALGLATGVIAQVINQMGAMGGKSIGGAILFIVVFVLGHMVNMAINILGAYVHTCRLQYVEFFGKFYDGTGKAFTPFAGKTKYVNFTENKKPDNKEELVS